MRICVSLKLCIVPKLSWERSSCDGLLSSALIGKRERASMSWWFMPVMCTLLNSNSESHKCQFTSLLVLSVRLRIHIGKSRSIHTMNLISTRYGDISSGVHTTARHYRSVESCFSSSSVIDVDLCYIDLVPLSFYCWKSACANCTAQRSLSRVHCSVAFGNFTTRDNISACFGALVV